MRRPWLFYVFLLLFLVGFIGIILSMLGVEGLRPRDGAGLFAALLAGAIVWWQGYLIKQQMELQAALELYKEWNSREMLGSRRRAWNDQNEVNEDVIEEILEFFEKVSSFEKRGVISIDLIWDTFGWYMWRYYFYSKTAIETLRRKWAPKRPDETLYQELEAISPKLLALEIEGRNDRRVKIDQPLTQQDIIEELNETRGRFIAGEKGRA